MNGVPDEWFWNFGDGRKSVEENPRHRFIEADSFRISHYIRSSIGCFSDTIYKTIEVFDYPQVKAGPDLNVLNDGKSQMLSSIKGQILKLFWEPDRYLSNPMVISPFIINPDIDQEYKLNVIGRGGCIATDVMKITVQRPLKAPNTFTPNGDGINDKWEVRFLDQYPGAIIEIYTTRQELIYRNKGYRNTWDGNINGKPAHAGTYYYVIDTRSPRGKISGYVTVLR
jgi:gliding motility-associated-like protein